jgi:hypothetical protein
MWRSASKRLCETRPNDASSESQGRNLAREPKELLANKPVKIRLEQNDHFSYADGFE